MTTLRTSPVAALDKLFELAALLGDRMRTTLSERDLTPARAEVLLVLRHYGAAMLQREVSQALRCTPRHVTALVDALETRGLVDRRAHPTDRRASLITLTAEGSEAADLMDVERREAATVLFGDVSARDLEGFVRVADHVLQHSDTTKGP